MAGSWLWPVEPRTQRMAMRGTRRQLTKIMRRPLSQHTTNPQHSTPHLHQTFTTWKATTELETYSAIYHQKDCITSRNSKSSWKRNDERGTVSVRSVRQTTQGDPPHSSCIIKGFHIRATAPPSRLQKHGLPHSISHKSSVRSLVFLRAGKEPQSAATAG